jgi:hypothetical protein
MPVVLVTSKHTYHHMHSSTYVLGNNHVYNLRVHACYLQVTAPAVGGHYTRVPQMGQRSPRLVFRDPDIPGTIQASSPYYSQQAANSIQELVTDDSRGEA